MFVFQAITAEDMRGEAVRLLDHEIKLLQCRIPTVGVRAQEILRAQISSAERLRDVFRDAQIERKESVIDSLAQAEFDEGLYDLVPLLTRH